MPVYTFQDIIDAVKEEGRVDRGNDLDSMIKRIINEVYIKYTRSKEYPDLFVVDHNITIGTNAQSRFTVPVDFGKVKQVRYSTSTGESFVYLKQHNQFSLPYLTGYPQWWYIAGGELVLHPHSEVLTGGTHILRIDYFKIPPVLVNPSDQLLVDDLYPVIVTETLGRVRRYHGDEQGAQAFKKDAQESAGIQQGDN